MRSVVISSGHGKKIRGASKYLDEVDCAREVVEDVAERLRGARVPVKVFHDDTSTSQGTNLSTIVNYHNAQTRDLDVSVHFNAYQATSKPVGVEVLYVTQQQLASGLSAELAKALGLPNRGGKKRTDLYFLNNTSKPAILIEVCFVDSTADADAYKKNFSAACDVIAEHIGDVEILGKPHPPEPVEPAEPAEPAPPEAGTGVTNMILRAQGCVLVNINGDRYPLTDVAEGDYPVVDLWIESTGTVNINGQDWQIEPPLEQPPGLPREGWQFDIEATVFGGAADPNNSAYPPYAYIDDKVVGVALPWKWPPGPRPMVEVRNRANDKRVMTENVCLGPWMIDDDYWVKGGRPVAETCCINRTALPSGPNKGRVPSNGAGIDLTPAAAKAIGIIGKGRVDFRIVETLDA